MSIKQKAHIFCLFVYSRLFGCELIISYRTVVCQQKRRDKSRSKEVGGTVLGLSIVKHAVMIHKGKIKVNSEIGKGSEFIVVLPNNSKDN